MSCDEDITPRVFTYRHLARHATAWGKKTTSDVESLLIKMLSEEKDLLILGTLQNIFESLQRFEEHILDARAVDAREEEAHREWVRLWQPIAKQCVDELNMEIERVRSTWPMAAKSRSLRTASVLTLHEAWMSGYGDTRINRLLSAMNSLRFRTTTLRCLKETKDLDILDGIGKKTLQKIMDAEQIKE